MIFTDGLYEIEFQRAFQTQGSVLKRIRELEKQRTCYKNKLEELITIRAYTGKLERRIALTEQRLATYYAIRDKLEAYKYEISVNNPLNTERATMSKIINDAYEKAYQNQH